MKVRLIHLGRDRQLTLDQSRAKLTSQQIDSAKKGKPEKQPLPALAAPDCAVVLGSGTKQRKFVIVMQDQLQNPKTGQHWYFPFGLQLMIWLNADTW
jgi:hypothetical protein